MYYKVCSDCGSHLDPGELCDCHASHRPGRNEKAATAPVNYFEQNSNRSILHGSNNIGVPMPGKCSSRNPYYKSNRVK